MTRRAPFSATDLGLSILLVPHETDAHFPGLRVVLLENSIRADVAVQDGDRDLWDGSS